MHKISMSLPSAPPTLISLPVEILTRIASFTSGSSAAAFALTYPGFNAIVEPFLWRSLRLTLPEYWGDRPLLRPKLHPDAPQMTEEDWADALEQFAEEIRSEKIRERLIAMMMRADERRWGYVEDMRLQARAGDVLEQVTALGFASPQLLSLDIDAATGGRYHDEDRRPDVYDTLDFNISHRRLSFPSLLQLRIGPGSIHYSVAIANICDSAPRLQVLDVECTPRYTLDLDTVVPPQLQYVAMTFWGPVTHLWRLRFICAETLDREFAGQFGVLGRLLKSSPELEQLVIRGTDDSCVEDIQRAMCACPDLGDVYWAIPLSLFSRFPGVTEDLIGLRRIVLSFVSWTEVFDALPSIPRLHVLHLHLPADDPHAPPADPAHHNPYPAQKLTHTFSAGLKNCPSLQAIYVTPPSDDSLDLFSHCDEVERGVPTGVIRSMRYGTTEILHARLALPFHEVSDQFVTPDTAQGDTSVIYQDQGGRVRIKEFEDVDPVYQDFVDCMGMVVPLSILERMAEVEEMEQGWEGRNVEIGEEAWNVLLDWKEGW